MTVLPLPLVSIVIPVFNRQEIFAQSLASALAQDYPYLEIIVVDDGSEPAIIVPDLPRVKLIRQTNQGAPAARNHGVAGAYGDLVIFWDADVLAPKNFISKLFEGLEMNPGASYAYSDVYFGWKKMIAGEFDSERLSQGNYIHTAALIRKADFPEFDETLTKFQDWDLWLTMLNQGKTGVYVPNLAYKIVGGGTMSTWLPRIAYKAPFKYLPGIYQRVKRYEQAKQRVLQKHQLDTLIKK